MDLNQKIYLTTGLFLFFIQFPFQGDIYLSYVPFAPSYLLIFLIIGTVYSIQRRNNARKLINDKPLSSIVLNDYSFTAYASLSILSLIYTIFQGILLGSTSCFILNGVGLFFARFDSYYVSTSFLYAIASLLLLIIIRVIVEAFTLIFRVAEDISKAVNKQNV